jgi:hypothetical protein
MYWDIHINKHYLRFLRINVIIDIKLNGQLKWYLIENKINLVLKNDVQLNEAF